MDIYRRNASLGLSLVVTACLFAGCAITPEQWQRNQRLQQATAARYSCPQLEPVNGRRSFPPPFKVPQAERDAMEAMGDPCAATW